MKRESNPGKRETLPVAPSFEPTLQGQIQHRLPAQNVRIIYISFLALLIGSVTGFIGKGLVLLIETVTNLAFYGKFTGDASPAGNHLGWFVVLIPTIGGLIVGFMARYGSKAIRGHGIPEAMEQILTNNSKIPPKITFLKPLSAAVAIGTGGPFGAEGPIIATGGALGSFLGQVLHVSADERKVLLTAGAAAGMSAIFGSPVAAILLAIELLLFEFSARSLIPIALASITGAALHYLLFGTQAFFAMPNVAAPTSSSLAVYSVIGILIGFASIFVTKAVYAIEDGFEKLPIPWILHPMLGGIVVGVVGYFAPKTMGVGYDNISYVLSGNVTLNVLLVLCILKFVSWSIALGSGTSGGTLAPLFTIGGAAGALIGLAAVSLFPAAGIDIRVAALIGMAAMFTGASRALLTSLVFALETTLQANAFVPLLAGCTAAYTISYLLMKHNIMTEKIARRGITIPDSYTPNFAQNTLVSQLVATHPAPVILQAHASIAEVRVQVPNYEKNGQEVHYAVVDSLGSPLGAVSAASIFANTAPDTPIQNIMNKAAKAIYDISPVATAIELLSHDDTHALVVLSQDDPKQILGVITDKDILKAYQRTEIRKSEPERIFNLRKSNVLFTHKNVKG